MTKKKAIVVTVDDAAMKDIDGVVSRLTAKGMSVDRVMPITGVITGSCGSAKMSALGSIAGVSSVEEEVGIQLPPPDAPVQ